MTGTFHVKPPWEAFPYPQTACFTRNVRFGVRKLAFAFQVPFGVDGPEIAAVAPAVLKSGGKPSHSKDQIAIPRTPPPWPTIRPRRKHGSIVLRGQSERRGWQDDHGRELGRGLAKAGCHTLLVDLDPQCNATTGLGRQPATAIRWSPGMPIRQGVCETDIAGLDLLPGSRTFRDVETLTKDEPPRPPHSASI